MSNKSDPPREHESEPDHDNTSMEGHDDYVNDASEEQIKVDKRLVGQPFFSEYIQKRADDGVYAC